MLRLFFLRKVTFVSKFQIMRTLLFLLFILSFSISKAQNASTEQEEKVIELLENAYNSQDYAGIFELFAPNMKAFLPLEKSTAYFTRLNEQLGNIQTVEFDGYVRGAFASYKAVFDNGLFLLNVASNANKKITGIFIEPYKEDNLPVLERNLTPLKLPFNGEWTVFWGGDTVDLNYHVESKAQKNAFDIVITDNQGKTFKTDGKTNEDYFAFGERIIAPCDATVVQVVDGVPDNIPGEMNRMHVPGNTVILKTVNNEYLFFAHFKQNSIAVKQGQELGQGDLLGLCGNSGNSSEAHLHYHMQNTQNINKATGAKTYFSDILVNGRSLVDYSPIKGDRISN